MAVDHVKLAEETANLIDSVGRALSRRIAKVEALAERVARIEGALGVGVVGPGHVQASQAKRMALGFTVQKFASSGKRAFQGIASTGGVDRMGDTVNPLGAQYKLPLPLLLQHDHSKPIGWVKSARPTATGIEVSCEIAEGVGDADQAWELVKSELVAGLSIGFRPIKTKPTSTGYHFEEWEWFELSIVTVAANADARITAKNHRGAVKLLTLPAGAITLRRS